jgi:hypothetical protein
LSNLEPHCPAIPQIYGLDNCRKTQPPLLSELFAATQL